MRINHVSKLYVVSLILALAPYMSAQASNPAKVENTKAQEDINPKDQTHITHGTVNVYLANKNGLVVVTDSKLSGDPRVPFGQKLFKIDDHTICTIAGWFSDSGPTIGPDMAGNPSNPASLDMPKLMQNFISEIGPMQMTLARKIQLLSRRFASSLV